MVLKNKVAVVMGTSDGFGKLIVLKLAKEGINLALVARSKENLDEVKNECEGLGSPKVDGYPCDISDRLLSIFGEVQILLNIAGT